MSLGGIFVARMYNLPPRRYGARIVPNIRVKMGDGVALMTNTYHPKTKGRHPTILMRLPYGRKGFSAVAEVYAERGFNVVLQACRGTEKSGGEFDPLSHEREDGLATLRWIEQQPWYDGRLGTSGPSYLGYAQWAICDSLPEHSAMATKVTSAEFRSIAFPSGAFHLGLWLGWLQTLEAIRTSPLLFTRKIMTGAVEKRTLKASMTLPLIEADVVATGRKVPFWRRWFDEAVEDGPFWDKIDHRHRISEKTPPNMFISGWYDFMIDQLLRDYARMVELGHRPHLTVGPWFHVSSELQGVGVKETLSWMSAHLLGEKDKIRVKPVRLYFSGSDLWRDFDAYPPGPPEERKFFLGPGNILGPTPAEAAEPQRYRYDPADPTPNLGGAIFAFTGSGPVDNAPLEARRDVLKFTSEPLEKPLTLLGNARVKLYAKASLPHADFFVRLCDVSPEGVSINICDGLFRVTPETPMSPSGVRELDFTLHATAHTFLPGHRLRLQVSSGAHPRYARNTGTDEPIGMATTLRANDMTIFLDETRPSAIALPVHDLDRV